MDGQENPLAQIYSQKFHEVQKYLSLTGHVYTPAYVLVGANRWGKLPADVRDILRSVAVDAQEFVYATAEQMENDLLEKMKKSAIKVNSADKDAFIKASDGIYKEFGNKVSGALKFINEIQALAN